MKDIGAELLVTTIKGLADGSLKETPQETVDSWQLAISDLKHAPKIFTDTCDIDWNKSDDEVYNLIRGLSPYPGAFTNFEGKTLKIFQAKKEIIQPKISPGFFETDKKQRYVELIGVSVFNLLSWSIASKRVSTVHFLR